MPIVTAAYERCSYQVKAVRVTSDNMDDIARWCGGRVVGWNVQVPTGQNGDKIAFASIGNWITHLEKNNAFRVYKERSFLETFRKVVSEAEKYAAIHEKLMRIARAQADVTYYSDTTDGVLLLVETTAHEICGMV